MNFIIKMRRLYDFNQYREGSILVLSLWLLLLLSVFLVNIGLRIRQRVELVSRVEQRMKLHNIAIAGMKKGISALKYCLTLESNDHAVYVKSYLRNNEEKFKAVKIGEGSFSVFYKYYDWDTGHPKVFYGFIDEESKININTADKKILQRLILKIITADEDEALFLADAIIDWRSFGKSRIDGFLSDNYYSNLEYPYEKKSLEYELIDELMLVQGVNRDVALKLRPFITVYGGGSVNINTASSIILSSLGLSDNLVNKIISVRRGSDGIDGTMDDHIFLKTFDIASDVAMFEEVTEKEAREIDSLNSAGLIKTNSSFYLIESEGKLIGKSGKSKVSCVFDISENKIIYYREK